MNDIIQAVIDNDFVSFSEKFKVQLKTNYDSGVEQIAIDAKKSIFETAMVADTVCKNCGKDLPIAIQGPGSCAFCGTVIT